ncbi:MAG TPA: hypothetical protein VGU24_21345 [Microvirga sp.]|jgi:hypothetical protein|nr:hypothetical protein [Microvirga sp.]
MMIDTQILSYAFKGAGPPITGARIATVVANEFLEVYDAGSTTNFRYYIRYLSTSRGSAVSEAPSTRKPKANERLLFDFGTDYPALVEHGPRATAAIINDRNEPAYAAIVSSLEKETQKKLKRRFTFLCAEVSECVALSKETAELGAQLLDLYTQQETLKRSFRNSVNDMMILATALSCREVFHTQDGPLARFVARLKGASVTPTGPRTIAVDFSRAAPMSRGVLRESKGYIHRGWRIAHLMKGVPPP